MANQKLFQPADRVQECQPPANYLSRAGGDLRDGSVYVYHDQDIVLAVRVAQVTGRPLLVSGPSGSGKSSLAMNVALTLNHRFYEFVVSSETSMRDLLWRFDAVRRLSDAQVTKKDVQPDAHYVEPGPLWWAFDRESAANRGSEKSLPKNKQAIDPWTKSGVDYDVTVDEAVVLIDEIDKADPNVPNDLLVPLGSYRFHLPRRGKPIVARKTPLVFITTNGERELPAAFERRCVSLSLFPRLDDFQKARQCERQKMVDIADAVMKREHQRAVQQWQQAGANEEDKPSQPPDVDLLGSVADFVLDHGSDIDATDVGSPWPSTAKYLDVVRACRELGCWPNGDPAPSEFDRLTEMILRNPKQETV